MKKLTPLILVTTLFSSVISAQHSTQLGIKGGVNFSALHVDQQSSTHRTGINAGLLAHIHLSPHLALQPEAMYSSQGAEYTDDVKTKLHYINVPVLVQYMFGKGLRLQTGPQVSFLTGAETKTPVSETSANEVFDKTDVAWSLGTGYLTRSGLGVDVRYNLGLTDISKNNADLRNRVWQVAIFYQCR